MENEQGLHGDQHHQRISDRAHQIWVEQGCPDGCEKDHWQQAEAELSIQPDVGDTPMSKEGSSPNQKTGRSKATAAP